jgi:hypothetical protein
MAEAPVIPWPVGSGLELVNRIEKEGRGEARDVRVGRFLYRVPGVSGGGRFYTDLIAVSVVFETPLKLPRLFLGEVEGERTALCRAFVGMEQGGAAMPFSEMETADGSGVVWVFPRAGTKYHGEYCSYIENDPKERMLTISIKKQYGPCEICAPAGLSYGNLVYCFKTGSVYHRGECPTVTKYVTSIVEKEAENRGYTACSRCGGQGQG